MLGRISALGLAFAVAAQSVPADAAQRGCTTAEKSQRPILDVAIDAATGMILSGQGENTPFFQASLTKRMTLLLTLDAISEGRLNRDQIIPLSEKGFRFRNAFGETQDGDPVRFEFSSISVNDAMMAMNLRSSNRAPLALAKAIGGTEENFVAMMNAKAAALGLNNTRFVNATGYPTQAALSFHRTTPLDHAKIVQRLYADYPQEMERLRVPKAELTGYKDNGKSENFHVAATLKLMPGKGGGLSLPAVLGGKTGTACVASALDAEATIDGRTVIAVVSGAERDKRAFDILGRPGMAMRTQLAAAARQENILAQMTPINPVLSLAGWPVAVPALPNLQSDLLSVRFNRMSLPLFNNDNGKVCLAQPYSNPVSLLTGKAYDTPFSPAANYSFLQQSNWRVPFLDRGYHGL